MNAVCGYRYLISLLVVLGAVRGVFAMNGYSIASGDNDFDKATDALIINTSHIAE